MAENSKAFHLTWVGLEIFGGVLTQMFPEYKWVGYLVMASGASMALYGITLWTKNRWLKSFRWSNRVPINEASIRLYEATQNNSLHSLLAERYKDIEGWYATELVQGPDDAYDIPVYGRKPPSRKIIQIPVEHLRNGVVGKEPNTYVSRDDDIPNYVDLEIKRSDLRKRRKEIKKHFMGKENGNR